MRSWARVRSSGRASTSAAPRRTPTRFRRTAVAFEDLAVAAYKGQAPLIQRRAYLVPALAIHTVEARHAAWIRRLAGFTPAAGRVRRAALEAEHAGDRRGHEVRGHEDPEPEPAEIHRLTTGLRAAPSWHWSRRARSSCSPARGEPAARPAARAHRCRARARARARRSPSARRCRSGTAATSRAGRRYGGRSAPACARRPGAAVVARLGTRTPERTTNIVAVARPRHRRGRPRVGEGPAPGAARTARPAGCRGPRSAATRP